MMSYVSLTGGSHLGNLDFADTVDLLVVGIFRTGICYCIYSSSLRYLRGQEASILNYTDPLIAVVISVPLFHERTLPL